MKIDEIFFYEDGSIELLEGIAARIKLRFFERFNLDHSTENIRAIYDDYIAEADYEKAVEYVFVMYDVIVRNNSSMYIAQGLSRTFSRDARVNFKEYQQEIIRMTAEVLPIARQEKITKATTWEAFVKECDEAERQREEYLALQRQTWEAEHDREIDRQYKRSQISLAGAQSTANIAYAANTVNSMRR